MHQLRRQSQAGRRRCHRGVGIHPRPLRGEAHRAPAPGLSLLREVPPGALAASSWINQVERFFALLTEQQIKRGAHRSTAELKAAIERYIETYNRDPAPFRWTKSADDILASIGRFCQRTLSVQA